MNERECSIVGCDKPAAPKGRDGLCYMHRSRMHRHGSVDGHAASRRTLPDASPMRRLLAGIVSDGGCWIWATGNPYGSLNINGRKVRAHVLMWETYYGSQVPAGLEVCHACDNPRCINPSHLWLGTHADNVRDMLAKGRGVQIQPGCDVDDCTERHYGRGYCKRHYDRIIRRGGAA